MIAMCIHPEEMENARNDGVCPSHCECAREDSLVELMPLSGEEQAKEMQEEEKPIAS